ncbi:MAG: hypothetical protein ACJAZ2_000672 [Glaciecola sp.]|jgi:hypothetical protein
MKEIFSIFILYCVSFTGVTQTPSEIIALVKLDSLVKTVREFSGEDSCSVGGNKIKLINRVSNSGNDLAADYLVERLNAIGVTVTDDVYSALGRNVYATQLGTVHPDSIVMIGCHYDAVADYCADDNASGVGILLEAARILSKYQFKKTIVYAFWDEEEIGLLGSKHHALQANSRRDKITAVLNIDMAAYDANNDGVFDIDLNTNTGSVKMKDDLIAIDLANNLNITPMVVQPGTADSDHSSFWNYGYAGVLLGESWETNDQNSKYHTAQDRIHLFNLPYYHEIAKLAIAYLGQIAESVSGVSVQNTVVQPLNAYLNQSTNNLHVNLLSSSILKLIDVNGQLLIEKQLPKGQSIINVDEFQQGIYLVQTYANEDQKLSEIKIIKN